MKTNKLYLTITVLTLAFTSSLSAQKVGINTENPQAALDINGDVVIRTSELEVSDSLVTALDVNSEKFSSYRITEADSSFTLAGITAGMDGRLLTLINQSGFPMEINNEDTLAEDDNRIITGNQEDFTLEDMGMMSLQYDTSVMKWIVNSTNQVPAGADVWDTTEMGIFFEEFVGIGTEDPTSPLSIQTDVDEIGFSHMAGEDSITVASSVSELAGSVGTTTDHVFSLNAGGEGKMHILPDGNVVIGEDSVVQDIIGVNPTRTNNFDSKLTVIDNYLGYQHMNESNEVIVREGITSIGGNHYGFFGTSTDHPFRLTSGYAGSMVHLYGTGQTVFGNPFDEPDGKLSIFTLNSSFGFVHQSYGGIRFRTHVGQSSYSLGTSTVHNLRFVTQDSARLSIMWDGKVGVGIADPTDLLTVTTGSNSFGFAHRSTPGIYMRTHVGEVSASIGTWSNHNMRLITNGLTRLHVSYDGRVGIGTIFPTHLFEVNGTMRAKELIIETTGWPDYVFAKDYQLHSISDLEKFIKANHHLPNIPSAADVETNGIYVGDMQKKMLEKIEELTLHIIELNRRIESLEQEKH